MAAGWVPPVRATFVLLFHANSMARSATRCRRSLANANIQLCDINRNPKGAITLMKIAF